MSRLTNRFSRRLAPTKFIDTARLIRPDERFTGCGLGGALLSDALRRVVTSEIAAFALMVDAKDDTAADFYLHHGLIALPSLRLTLFLPLATARTLIG